MSNDNLFEILGIDDTGIWSGMPRHEQNEWLAEFVLVVNLYSEEDLHKFADLIDQKHIKQKAKTNVKSIWYPKLVNGERGSNVRYVWLSSEDEV